MEKFDTNSLNSKNLLIACAIFVVVCGGAFMLSKAAVSDVTKADDATTTTRTYAQAERVEVLHFHAEQQCWSCETVGRLARQTISERFAAEAAAGRVVFLDINASKPENAAIVNRFGATGSSLFLNAVVDGRDNIEMDSAVWRLIYNETKYVDYLAGRISLLLGQ